MTVIGCVALPYIWAVRLQEWSQHEVDQFHGLIQPVSEEEPKSLEDQLSEIKNTLQALLKEGGKEIKIQGSDFVSSPQKGLVRLISDSGKHIGMLFRTTIAGKNVLVTAKHANSGVMNPEFALVTSGQEGRKMKGFSFFGKEPILRAKHGDIVGYELNSKDMSYLKGAKNFKMNRTPGVGTTLAIHAWKDNGMKLSFGTLEQSVGNMMFSHSVSTEGGYSGAPIMNTEGSVVGIHLGFKGSLNLGYLTDPLIMLVKTETSEDLWKKKFLLDYEDDIVLVDEDREENEIDVINFELEEYILQQRENMYRLDSWAEREDDELSNISMESKRENYGRETTDFPCGANTGHQDSQGRHIGGVRKLRKEETKRGGIRTGIFGPAASLTERQAVQSRVRWDRVSKSGRSIPRSLLGLGYQDLISIKDEALASTLIDLAELLGLQTASNSTYWLPLLPTLGNTPQRRLLKMWAGILRESGFLPLVDKRSKDQL
jgi:hypothetical protein